MRVKSALTAWLRAHDPGLAATRRAARTAVVMPALFALCGQLLHSPVMATYAAFGAFAMLLLVDFAGPPLQRVRAHLGLAVAWLLLICLGTLAAPVTWVAVTATVVVGFTVLFSGVVSSVLSGASTALLLAFLLPVASPGPLSQLPERLAGAALASAAALLAVPLLWPRKAADPLSAPAARVCRAVAAQLRTDADHLSGGAGAPGAHTCRRRSESTADATAELRGAFEETPYRPTGLSAQSRALVRLVDELTWLSTIVADSAPEADGPGACDLRAVEVRRTVAAVLAGTADVLDRPRGPTAPLDREIRRLHAAMRRMEHDAGGLLPRDLPQPQTGADVRAFTGTLELSFRAQELGFVTVQIARNVQTVAAAERRSWPDRLLGREPDGPAGPLDSARERAAAHLRLTSVSLHNSLRGAAGLGLAVALSDLTDVQRSFWVLLGTLSVLRSNALSTGQSAIRALGGTVLGSVVGAGLLGLVGHHGTVLWFLLPVAVLIAGIAPSAVSFTAGQAAFTFTLVILFNIGVDPDWHIALLRVEDIGIGCAVSVVVGLLLWPRGAAAAVDKALAEAYAGGARYLDKAVEWAIGHRGVRPSDQDLPVDEGRAAAAASRRLDDAFRSLLAERGVKRVSLADLAGLVTGVVGLRLAGDAVIELWRRADGQASHTDRAEARSVVLGTASRVTGWYRDLATSLAGRTAVRDPVPDCAVAEAGLVRSLRRDLCVHGHASDTAVRMVWTVDYLNAARRLQPSLVAAARSDGPAPPAAVARAEGPARPARR